MLVFIWRNSRCLRVFSHQRTANKPNSGSNFGTQGTLHIALPPEFCTAVHYEHHYYYCYHNYCCIIITIAVCAPITPRANWGQLVCSAWRESIHCSQNAAFKCFQRCHFAQLSQLDIWTEWLPQLWGDGNSAGPFKIMCQKKTNSPFSAR